MGLIRSTIGFPFRRPKAFVALTLLSLGASGYLFGPIATITALASGASTVAGAFSAASETVTGAVTSLKDAVNCPGIVREAAAAGITQDLAPKSDSVLAISLE